MRPRSLIQYALLVVTLFGFAASVEASPIVYMESGFASGTIGGSAFTNALVQVTASGDTANVVTLTFGTITVYANLSSLTRVTIAGIGTATITDPIAVYSFPAAIDIDPGAGSLFCHTSSSEHWTVLLHWIPSPESVYREQCATRVRTHNGHRPDHGHPRRYRSLQRLH